MLNVIMDIYILIHFWQVIPHVNTAWSGVFLVLVFLLFGVLTSLQRLV